MPPWIGAEIELTDAKNIKFKPNHFETVFGKKERAVFSHVAESNPSQFLEIREGQFLRVMEKFLWD